MTAGQTSSVRRVADRRYLVAGFAEALLVLSDQRLSNDPANGLDLHPDITAQPAVSQRRGTSMQLCDAPQHNRLRRAVAAALSQRSYAGQLDQMKRRADDLFDALLARGAGDLVADFVLPVVFEVICDLLGVPEVDRAQVHIWSDDSTLPDPDVSTVGGGALDDYVASLLAAKSVQPAAQPSTFDDENAARFQRLGAAIDGLGGRRHVEVGMDGAEGVDKRSDPILRS